MEEAQDEVTEGIKDWSYITVEELIKNYSFFEKLDIVYVSISYDDSDYLFQGLKLICKDSKTDPYLNNQAINNITNERTHVFFEGLNANFSLTGNFNEFIEELRVGSEKINYIKLDAFLQNYNCFKQSPISKKVISGEIFEIKPISSIVILH